MFVSDAFALWKVPESHTEGTLVWKAHRLFFKQAFGFTYNFVDQNRFIPMSVQYLSSSNDAVLLLLSTMSHLIITAGLGRGRVQVTCVLSGGVGQVESMATVVGPTHELDSDLVAG